MHFRITYIFPPNCKQSIWTNCLQFTKENDIWGNKPWHRHIIFDLGLLNNTNLHGQPPNPPCLWSIFCLLLFIMPIKEHLFNPAEPKSTETFLSFWGKILSYEMKPIKEKSPFCIQLCRTLSYCDEQKPRMWCQDKITIKKLPALPYYQTYPWI